MTAPLLAALTAYLLLDRNHAEELGGGARAGLDLGLDLARALDARLLPALVACALLVSVVARAAR